MKAYAILDGGGVRGAALAGCLKAAEELGISFVGYGGTSAGSIVAKKKLTSPLTANHSIQALNVRIGRTRADHLH